VTAAELERRCCVPETRAANYVFRHLPELEKLICQQDAEHFLTHEIIHAANELAANGRKVCLDRLLDGVHLGTSRSSDRPSPMRSSMTPSARADVYRHPNSIVAPDQHTLIYSLPQNARD